MFMYQEGKKVEEYDGSRSVDDLMEFVKRFAQNNPLAETERPPPPPEDIPETEQNEATKLTADNFKENVAKGVWLVEHFSPLCYHCKQFAPTWRQFVADAKQDSPSVKMGQIDCIVHAGTFLKGYGSFTDPLRISRPLRLQWNPRLPFLDNFQRW
jgi:thioredoxin-like negative regulator of GroEL